MSASDARAVRDQLKAWLLGRALPLWADVGVDHAGGGFCEKIGMDGRSVAAPRRARVATRQIYSFALAGELGWDGPWRRIVGQGLASLLTRYRRDDGLFRLLVAPDGAVLDDTPAPYEQAFVMLALSAAHRLDPSGGWEATAVETREALRGRFGRPDGGFFDSEAREGPLKANPHMHLLEASLAWAQVGADPDWSGMARAIAGLALDRMIEPATGALGELFDDAWTRLPGADVEPGHQFEWGWLLLKSGAAPQAARLIALAEEHGVDRARGVAFNALGADLKPRDLTARLWPQTERLKAAVAIGDWGLAARAGQGLLKYLDTPVPGLWRDRMEPDGSFVDEPAPASSFYHIVGAIADLDRALG